MFLIRKKILNILLIFIFVLSNSHLFFYQHFCGEELYGSSIFHTLSCECGDEMHPLNMNDWIISEDDGCCREVIVYPHHTMPFYSFSLVLSVFLTFLCLISLLVHHSTPYSSLFHSIRFLFYRFLKRRPEHFFHLFSHSSVLKTVILRN